MANKELKTTIYSESNSLFPGVYFPKNDLSMLTADEPQPRLCDRVKDDGKVLKGKWSVEMAFICPSHEAPKSWVKGNMGDDNDKWVSDTKLTNPTYKQLRSIHNRYLLQSGDWHYGMFVSNIDYKNRIIFIGADS
jgi:hypothetical protein